MLFDQGIDIPEALSGDALNIALEPEKARFNVRVKSKDVAAFKKASGFKFPVKIGATAKTGTQLISKFGPDEWVISDDAKSREKIAKKLSKLAGQFVMSATDISHRNIAFNVSGRLANEAVNIGCPLDLSLKSFPVGKATRTIFENAPIQLYRSGEDTFQIECWRSFAPYMVDFWTAFSRDIA
ncbi:MAG: sarcosine oxidase subunit gamma [Hyphomonadaceae bacterium]|nr:sarcosine oxidase subunit gamma [Hyphomonadaceae bacterium]